MLGDPGMVICNFMGTGETCANEIFFKNEEFTLTLNEFTDANGAIINAYILISINCIRLRI